MESVFAFMSLNGKLYSFRAASHYFTTLAFLALMKTRLWYFLFLDHITIPPYTPRNSPDLPLQDIPSLSSLIYTSLTILHSPHPLATSFIKQSFPFSLTHYYSQWVHYIYFHSIYVIITIIITITILLKMFVLQTGSDPRQLSSVQTFGRTVFKNWFFCFCFFYHL